MVFRVAFVQTLGANGNTVWTWSRQRRAHIASERDDREYVEPWENPPPGWADVGRPGQKQRDCRRRDRGRGRG